MLLPRPRCFVGCEMDNVCLKESLLVAVKIFTRQVLKKESYIAGGVGVQAAAKVLVSGTDGSSDRHKKL